MGTAMKYKVFSPNYDECPMLDLTSASSCRDAIWQTGHKIDQTQSDLSSLVFESEHEHIQPFPDFSMDGNGCPVFSSRLKELLISLGVDNIDYYPVSVIEFETNIRHDNYFAGNIIGRIDCMDYENSQYSTISGKVFRIEKLVTHEDYAHKSLIFRLKDVPRIILADTFMDEKIKAAGITGLYLIPIDKWDNAYGYL